MLPDDVADHVLGGVSGRRLLEVLHVHLAAADRPLGDVVRPDVRRHGGRGLAVTEGGKHKWISITQFEFRSFKCISNKFQMAIHHRCLPKSVVAPPYPHPGM